MISKRKKNSRQRGSKTHGWGSMKKHRGAGNRGGRGMAGSGKRADQKKSKIIKEVGLKKYFGKHGFKRPQRTKQCIPSINVGDLDFSQTDVNLKEIGFKKLLGKGNPNKKYNLKVELCSQKAKDKIEKAGGNVEIIK